MSKTPQKASTVLNQTIRMLLEQVALLNEGELTERASDSSDELSFSLSLLSGKYYLCIILFWSGRCYEVTSFFSNPIVDSPEQVEERGEFMPAPTVLSYEMPEGTWKVRSAANLLALFEKHNFWSKIFGYKTVFKFE